MVVVEKAHVWRRESMMGGVKRNGMGCYGGVDDVVKRGTLVVLIGTHIREVCLGCGEWGRDNLGTEE